MSGDERECVWPAADGSEVLAALGEGVVRSVAQVESNKVKIKRMQVRPDGGAQQPRPARPG